MPNGMSVDQLNIEISASAKTANSAIDALCGKLDLLSKSLNSLNSVRIDNISKTFGSLSKTFSSSGLSNGAKSIASLNRSFANLGKMDTSSIAIAKNAISELRNSLKLFEDIKFGDMLSQIAGFNRSIASLGGKSALQAVDNIPKLAKAMNELMATLSKAPTVNQNIIDMTNALAKLARTGSSSGRAVNSLTNIFDRSKKKSFSLASALGKMYATYWLLFRAFGKIKDAIDISAKLTEVQNVVDVTFGKQRNLVEEMAKTSITDFGMSELTVKEVSSRFQAMGSAMGIANKQVASSSEFLEKKGVTAYGKLGDSMGNVSVNLTKLAADMASFYNVEQKDVAEDLESVFTGASRPLREYGLDLTQATLKEFALKNGLDANIESMSQAEKTMLRYQYVMANTGAAQGDFARTANTWANQVRILKQNFQQLGSIFGGVLINAFKPVVTALNVVIGKFIEFAKVVSDSLGKIFGWTYNAGSSGGGVASDLEAGAEASEGVSDGMGGAADNAKKLRQQLQGFDELNVLSSNDSSGGGSGGGSGGVGAGGASSSGGEWTKSESILSQFESNLDNLWKLGDYISTTLTDALNGINWESVYEGARNFGTGLASFLNGLISPDLFGALGNTIAGSINTAIEAAYSFVTVFQWDEFGESIGSGINSCLDNIDFTKLMQTLSGLVSGLLDTLSSAIQETDWGKLGSTLVQLIKDVDWASISSSFFEALGSALGGLLEFIGGVVSEAFDGLADFISGCLDENGQLTIEGFLKGVGKALKNIGKWIKENIFQPFIDGFKKAFDINSPAETMVGPGEYVIEGFFKGLKSAFEDVLKWFSELPSKLMEKIKNGWEAAKKWWKENVNLPKIDVPTIGDIKAKIQDAWEKAKSWWNSRKSLSTIAFKIGSIKDKLRDAWTKARNWWNKNKPSLSQITAKIKIPRLVITWDTKGAAAKVLQKLGLKGFPNFSVRYYAMGGFPEDGWFRANHGELMGKFDNGRTVVANNKQITQGIAEAVYQGNRENNSLMRQELELMRRQNELLMDLVEKETGFSAREVFNTVRKEAENYKRVTGRTAFAL